MVKEKKFLKQKQQRQTNVGATGSNVSIRVAECRFTVDYSVGIKISFLS